MIKLRVVGSDEDHEKLILSNKPRGKKGTHAVAIDQRLFDVLQEAVYARRERQAEERRSRLAAPPRAEPKVPPREIQQKLRSGLTPAQVATQAGVDEEYVERFLQPVIYERIEVVNEAQELYQEKPRLGASGAPLGEAIAANLAARHVNLEDEALAEAWMATRANGGPWTLALTFPFRGRARTARWRFDQRARTILPVNKLAADIGWIAAGKVREAEKPTVRVVTATGVMPPSTSRKPARKATARKAAPRKAAPRKAPARKTPARKAAGRKTSARRPSARKKPVARKPAARRSAVRKPAARRAPARKTPTRRAPARKAAAKRAPARRPAARRSPVRRSPRKAAARKAVSRKRAPARRTPARRTPARRTTATRRRR